MKFNLTVGVAITLLIWDNDESFITAAQKLIDFAKKLNEETNGGEEEPSDELVAEAISVITWLLVHINEIFTGDELFVLNPITWQNMELIPQSGFDITKTWYDSQDYYIGNGDDHIITAPLQWGLMANYSKDSYMQWLLTDFDPTALVSTFWTQFSFDLAQLWIKNFFIQIDVAELTGAVGGEEVNVADVFQGCDIEFFLFTHHLAGAFLYDDNNTDSKITVNYARLENDTTHEPILERTAMKFGILLHQKLLTRLCLGMLLRTDLTLRNLH